jgi:type IV secretion system protein VirD4
MNKTILALIAAILLAFLLLRWRLAPRPTTFGSAGWLPAWTASGKGLFRKGGVIAGDWAGMLPVQYKGSGHALTVAPTGAGKGTSAIIPNLLRHPWIFMLDPGGENTAVACKAWRDKGYSFICLNPWKMHTAAPWCLPSHAVNPLAILDPASETFASDADLLAEMIVARTGREGGNTAYFKDEAQAGIRAFLMHIVTAEPVARRNLLTLRKYISAQPHEWEALLLAMKRNLAAGGVIAREAAQFERREVQSPEEFSAILSTIKQDTNFIEDPVMQAALAGNSAGIEALKGSDGGKRIPGCVVSVVMPLQYLDTHAAYARLITGVALWTMQRGPLSRGRVLFLLDEFAALKRMDRIQAGLATLRKYRVWLWPIIQNIGQLMNIYGANWQTFMSNAGFKQFMAAGDLETAEYVSKLCGDATILVKNRNGGGRGGKFEARRVLATPDEVMVMRADLQIVFADNLRPMLLRKTAYWERPELKGTYHPNPYHAGTPPLPAWARPARVAGQGLRFAAWLMRPSATVVAAAVMGAVFTASPGVLTEQRFTQRPEMVCRYATMTGQRWVVIRGPQWNEYCAPVYARGVDPVWRRR